MSDNILVISYRIQGGEIISIARLLSSITTKDSLLNLKYLNLNERLGSKRRLSFLTDTIRYYSQACLKIVEAINKSEFKYIFVSDYLWALAALRVKPGRTKIIFSFHGLKSVPFNKISDIDYRQIVIKFLERLSWILSDVITVPSKEGLRYIYKSVGSLINKRKVFIVPNIVPQSFFVNDKLYFKNSNYNILYSGRIGRNKGLENLIRAFSKLVIGLPQTTLTIATPSSSIDKPTLLEINKLATFMDKQHFRIVTDLTESKLARLYSESDVTILPSVIEFAPLSVLESLAAGTPVIATKVGNLQSLLSKIDPCLLLENNSADEIYKKLLMFSTYKINVKHILEKKCIKIASKYTEEEAANRFKKVLSFLDNNAPLH